jgi:general secretion pathway protein I
MKVLELTSASPSVVASFPRKRESMVMRQRKMGPRLRGDGCTRLASRVSGFSLLEVLAAFVILALVGTALFRVFSGALGNVAVSEEYSRATLYAESRLAALGVEAPLREGAQQGTSDDGYYAWTAKIESYTPPGITADMDSAAATMAIRIWRLAVTVRWPGVAGSERSIALATMRVAARELTLTP